MRLRTLLVLAMPLLAALSSSAHLTLASGEIGGALLVNYITEINPVGSIDDFYVDYILSIHNKAPHTVELLVTIDLPRYSRVVAYSGPASVNESSITWHLLLQPYGQGTVQVRLRPAVRPSPLIDVGSKVLLNSRPVASNVASGGVGSRVHIELNITNHSPYPPLVTVSLAKQEGLSYGFTQAPTLIQSISGANIYYWINQLEGSLGMEISLGILDMGPWHSIRLSPVVVQALLNINGTRESLLGRAKALNLTLAQLGSFLLNMTTLASLGENLTGQLLELARLINETATSIGYAAYLINSTLLIQGSMMAQLASMRMALATQQLVLAQLEDALGALGQGLSNVASATCSLRNNLTQLVESLASLRSTIPSGSPLAQTLDSAYSGAVAAVAAADNACSVAKSLANSIVGFKEQLGSARAQLGIAIRGIDEALGAGSGNTKLIMATSKSMATLGSRLGNLSGELVKQYFSLRAQQALFGRRLMDIRAYANSLRAQLMDLGTKAAGLEDLARAYVPRVTLTNVTGAALTLSIQETYVLKLPALVDTTYLSTLLNSTVPGSIGQAGQGGGQGGVDGKYLLLIISTLTVTPLVIYLVTKRVMI